MDYMALNHHTTPAYMAKCFSEKVKFL